MSRVHAGSSKIGLLALATTVALGGCAVGPDYVRPVVSTTPEYLGQKAVAARTAVENHGPQWWLGFQDPLLDRLIDAALAQNLDLSQSIARVQQARAALRFATATLLLSASVESSAARGKASLQTPMGQLLNATPGFDRTGEAFEANVGASWELDLFGGARRGRQSAIALYEAASTGVAAARLSVATQTADIYVTIRGLQARQAIAREQVEKQRQLVKLVQLQFDKGIASSLQADQAQGALAQVEASLPALAIALDAALNAMDVVLGSQPGTHRAELMETKPVPRAPSIFDAGGPADLIRRRPDLVIAERKLAASNARIGAAMSEYYPKLSIAGLFGTATGASGDMFSSGAEQWQASVGLRWRLFDFGRVSADVALARGRNAEELAAYQLSVLRATEDVENAFSALVNREVQERVLATGEQSLTRARDASVLAYKGGVVSLIEVLDADSRLLSTRDAHAQVQTEAARAAIASFKALGGGWESGI